MALYSKYSNIYTYISDLSVRRMEERKHENWILELILFYIRIKLLYIYIYTFYMLSEFFKWSLTIFIIKGFQTIVFIFIVISTTFQPVCPPAFFRCLSNSGTYMELGTTSFIESTGVACSDSVSHNRVQVLSILVFACSQDWTCNLQLCPAGHIA